MNTASEEAMSPASTSEESIATASEEAIGLACEEATNVASVDANNTVSEEVCSVPDASTDQTPYRLLGLPNLDDISLRRSKRSRKRSTRGESLDSPFQKKWFNMFSMFCLVTLSTLATSASFVPSTIAQKVVLHAEKITANFDGTLNFFHHVALLTSAGSNDTYTFKQMLLQEDKNDFIMAMKKEIEDHEERNHWDIMLRKDLPPGIKTIMAIWSFKRKRFPDGRIQKHKARICAHGGQQTWGENYWETYAPVVNWLSVRTLLIVSMLNDLETRSIDFTLAFPQADLDVDVYMELPVGFDHEGHKGKHVLKLNKSLYGLKQAAYNWFQLLKSGLEARGYEHQSSTDNCVFLGKNSIVLVYVDDCIIISKKDSGISKRLIKSLKDGNENFQFTDEGPLDKYLGVNIKKRKDGKLELTQPHLIERFLATVNQDENINVKPTPAVKPLLHQRLQWTCQET